MNTIRGLWHYLPHIIGALGFVACRLTIDSDELLPLATIFLLVGIIGWAIPIGKQAWNHYKPEIKFKKENNNNGDED